MMDIDSENEDHPTQLWGEFDPVFGPDPKPVTAESDAPSNAAGDGCLSNLCQSSTEESDCKLQYSMDPLVVHTIKLLQYRRLMRTSEERLPPFPVLQEKGNRFGDSAGLPSNLVYPVLRKAAAAMAAHFGFQDAEFEALESVTDCASEVLDDLCSTLKFLHERRLLGRESAFGSALVQMLEMKGVGSITDLQLYYKKHVVDYHERVEASVKRELSS